MPATRLPSAHDLNVLNGRWRDHPRYHGCVGHWLINEGGGRFIRDISGSNAHGTLNGTLRWDTAGSRDFDASGQGVGAGHDFDGSSAYIQTESYMLQTATNFTISAWFVCDDLFVRNMVWWQGDVTGNGGGAEHEINCCVGQTTTGSATELLEYFAECTTGSDDIRAIGSQGSFTSNDWNHIVVVASDLADAVAHSGTIYLNGDWISPYVSDSTASSMARSNWDTAFRIGRPGVSDRYFNGRIADVRIYDRVLCDEEIESLYHQPQLEFDWAFNARLYEMFSPFIVPVGGGQTVVVNQATETNTPQSFAWAPKHRFVGQLTETQTLLPMLWSPKHRLVNLATETSTAQSITKALIVLLNQVNETDTVQSITWAPKSRLITIVTETDAALPIIENPKRRLVNQATETDEAQTLTFITGKIEIIGQVIDTSAVNAITWAPKIRIVGQVDETNQALPISPPGAAEGVYVLLRRRRRA